MKLDTKQAAIAILSKAKTIDEATIGFDTNEMQELDMLIKAAKAKMASKKMAEVCKTDSNGQWKIEKEEKVMGRVKVQMDSDTYEPRGKHDPVMESPKKLKKSWPDAQWSLEKAIKPGPTLDYSKINPKVDRAAQEAAAPVIDYSNNAITQPKRYAGAKEHAEAVRAKLDAETKEPALDTISRRQKMNKQDGMAALAGSVKNAFGGGGGSAAATPPPPAPTPSSSSGSLGSNIAGSVGRAMGKGDGVLVDKEPSPADKSKMMVKDESEPHKDDPEHEAKEKKKAKKIKKEAESLLDMHKDATKTEGQVD